MSAAKVLEAELLLQYGEEPLDTGFEVWSAIQLLDALKRAGYAVIELPKQTIIPTGWREDCLGCWPSGLGERAFEDPVSAWPDNEGISLPNGDFMSAERARVFAAALLAASDAAEVTS